MGVYGYMLLDRNIAQLLFSIYLNRTYIMFFPTYGYIAIILLITLAITLYNLRFFKKDE